MTKAKSKDTMKIEFVLDVDKSREKLGSGANPLIPPAIKNVDGLNSDAGIDLFAQHYFQVDPHSVFVADTFTKFKMPPGTFGMIFPRGGDNFLVGAGIIDAGYTGTVKVKIANIGSQQLTFNLGDSIGQLVIVPSYLATQVSESLTDGPELAKVNSIESIGGTARGASGRINK